MTRQTLLVLVMAGCAMTPTSQTASSTSSAPQRIEEMSPRTRECLSDVLADYEACAERAGPGTSCGHCLDYLAVTHMECGVAINPAEQPSLTNCRRQRHTPDPSPRATTAAPPSTGADPACDAAIVEAGECVRRASEDLESGLSPRSCEAKQRRMIELCN